MTDNFVCGLCSYFNAGDMNKSRILCTQDKEGVCGALLMYCDYTKSLQHLTFCSCESFLPSRTFFCVATDLFVESATCCRRQIDEGHCYCDNCPQGQMVISMMRGGTKRWEKTE